MSDQKQSPPPNSTVKTPVFKAPAGSCDCHVHIWGPQSEVSLVDGFPLKFYDALLEDYISVSDKIGIDRSVIVQAIPQGHDHRILLKCLRAYPKKFRGVAVPSPYASDSEIGELHEAGCRGIRVAYSFSSHIPIKNIERVAERGWHVQIVIQPENLAEWYSTILSLPCDIVIDHMGLPNAEDGINSEHFKKILSIVEKPNVWVKLTGMDKVSSQGKAPWLDTIPFARKIYEMAPERCLWGTDWPHPGTFTNMPDEADQLDILLKWFPNDSDRYRVLVQNPERLYGFPHI